VHSGVRRGRLARGATVYPLKYHFWPFAGSCEGPQDAGNGFPAILRPGFARVEFRREPMLRRVSTQFRKSLSDKMLGFEKPAKGQITLDRNAKLLDSGLLGPVALQVTQ
jgi:hypothetical protein